MRRKGVSMRAALYARVSTVDRGQDPEVQLGDLREYVARRGFEVVAEFVDFASGARNGRPEYQRMLDAARKRRFDILLVWRYDRFARSMQELVGLGPSDLSADFDPDPDFGSAIEFNALSNVECEVSNSGFTRTALANRLYFCA